MSKIYVASSWRNPFHHNIVVALRDHGHKVFDYRDTPYSFRWDEVGLSSPCTVAEYRRALMHPRSTQAFLSDFKGMQWADTGLLVLPSGRSAHIEIGWMAGAGKRTIIMTQDNEEPELMALCCDHVVTDFEELLQVL